MAGVTVALLGDLDVRREFGKVGTQSDIHLHDLRHGDRHLTTIVPARYPEQAKCLSYAVAGADAGVLVVDRLDASVGEQILAAHAAGLAHGAIVVRGHVQPDQVEPLVQGTILATWPTKTDEDWDAVRDHVAACPPRPDDGPAMVPVDHHFDVKGVGAVVLGVVRAGTVQKGDTLHAWPDGTICPVRSIQVHDIDVREAHAGDRVGLALRNVKADRLDRGQILAPADAPLRAWKAGDPIVLRLDRLAFARRPLGPDSVVHLGLGMQFVPCRLTGEAPAPGEAGDVEVRVEKAMVAAPGETATVWHVDAAPQRVVGRAQIV